MELLLSAKGISKSFQGRKVLDDIDIEIKKSEIIAISGASGAGKTTLLNILSTLDTPDETNNSSLIIDGENIFNLNNSDLSKLRNTKIGFVFQFHELIPELNVMENICLPGWIKNDSKVTDNANSLISYFGLDKLKKDGVIAVYDLGGGTFDISIIEMTNVDGEYQFEVISTSGDTHLGGEDFDLILINHFIDEFKKESGFDLNTDPMALQRLKEAAEKAKIELSTTDQTEVNLPYITADASGPKHLVQKITRAKLESLVGDLVNRSMDPVKTALKDAKLGAKDIDEVILVGGQTRMPMVQKVVADFFGKEARKDINPDEAVALGAATQGAVLSGERSDVLLLDVTPLTLGIETLGGVMTPMIEKNTTIPTNKSQVYSTAEDNQTAVTVHVLQGERKKASDNKSLGQFNLTDIPAAPRGTPQIAVTFDIDANGIINVSAKDNSTNKEQSITIQGGSGLSDEEIEKMVKDAEMNAEEDKKFEELIASRNMADGLASSTKKAMEENKDELSEDETKSLSEAIEKVEEACKSDSKEDIDKSVEELSKVAQPLSDKLFKKEAAQQPDGEATEKEDDAVDADFKEVDEEKDK